MPTVDQRVILSDMFKSLEAVEKLLTESVTTRAEISDRVVRLRRPGSEPLSEAAIIILRQKLTGFYNKVEELDGEIDALL